MRRAFGTTRGIGRVDAIDIGVDVAKIGLERDRDRNRAGVGAAAAERRQPVAILLDALEARDDRDLAAVEPLADASFRRSR